MQNAPIPLAARPGREFVGARLALLWRWVQRTCSMNLLNEYFSGREYFTSGGLVFPVSDL